VGGQLSAGVRVTSGVPQGSVLGPLLFLAYVNDIWRNMESTIRLFADDCVIYRKIINNADIKKLQKDLDRLGEWAVEIAMKINPSKSKAIRFTNWWYPCSSATRIPPQPSHTETPTHIETRTHDQCGDTIEKSQAPDDECINVRNMLSTEEVK